MRTVLAAKFSQHADLAALVHATGYGRIVELATMTLSAGS